MENNKKGGAAAQVQTTPQSDKGANTTAPKMEVVKKPDALQDKLLKLANLNKLQERRAKLLNKVAEVQQFELKMDGEQDEIFLTTKDGTEVVVRKPEAVKKVLELLKGELSTTLEATEQEFLSIAA